MGKGRGQGSETLYEGIVFGSSDTQQQGDAWKAALWFSLDRSWPSSGQGVAPHDLSGQWSCQVLPAVSLL